MKKIIAIVIVKQNSRRSLAVIDLDQFHLVLHLVYYGIST